MLPLTIVERRYFESVSLRFPNGSFLTRRLERASVTGLRFIWFAGRALRCPDWRAVKMPHFCAAPDHEGGAAAKSGAWGDEVEFALAQTNGSGYERFDYEKNTREVRP